MSEEINNILEHIMKAKKQALRDNIKANTIVIDKDIAKINGFYFQNVGLSFLEIPPTIVGLKIAYSENLSDELGIDANFVIGEQKNGNPLADYTNDLEKYTTEELLDEINKRIRGNEE